LEHSSPDGKEPRKNENIDIAGRYGFLGLKKVSIGV